MQGSRRSVARSPRSPGSRARSDPARHARCLPGWIGYSGVVPNLLAMSFEGELAPSFTLRCLEPGRTLPDGWGLGYYPKGEPSAAILKEPAPPQTSIR